MSPSKETTRTNAKERPKQVCVQLLHTLTTWHCPHSPAAAAARRQFSNRSISSGRRAHSSKPAAAAGWDGRTDRQTDGRTQDSFIDPAMRAVPMNQQTTTL